ncbi:MAG: M60 family metallopeptidase [Planctomycetota bacterium]
MKSRLAVGIGLSLILVGFGTQSSAGDEDIPRLLEGVSEIASPGVPGPICVFGKDAFPVVAGRCAKIPATVVAASRWGRGRIVAFGHNGYFGTALQVADTGTFVLNVARWAGGKSRKKNPGWRIGVRKLPHLVAYFKERKWRAESLDGAGWATQLAKIQVVFTSLAALGPGEREALVAFVRNGGGLVSGVPGWGWQQLHPNQSLAEDFPGNRIFAQAGIVWGTGYMERTSEKGYAVKPGLPRMLHGKIALDALESQAKGKSPLGKEEAELAIATLTNGLSALPASDRFIRPRLASLLKSKSVPLVWPSPEKPLTYKAGLGKVLLAFQIRRNREKPIGEVTAHPAADRFPGAVPGDARRVTRSLKIDTGIPGWHGTGLYAPPGQIVSVHIPAEASTRGWFLQISPHRDKIWDKPRWRRAPEICRRFPCKSPVTKGVNAFGGLVYIDVPQGQSSGTVTIRVSGVVEAPLYIRGTTSPETWRETLRHHPAPWGELATEKVIITLPSTVLRNLDDPAPLLAFWDGVLDACADLAVRPRKRERPERYVADAQISAGYMHAGYPIMTHLDAAPRFVNLGHLRNKGDWGMFHEVGHNHQSRLWTFDGAGEVTVNLFTLYILETQCPKAAVHKRLQPKAAAEAVRKYIEAGADFKDWKKSPFLALLMYVQLKDAFGWDAYKEVFKAYRDLPKSARPKNDGEERDQWMVRFSRTVGRNLGPFFQAWGVPTSKKARDSIARLPVWMPPGFPPKPKDAKGKR